MRILPQVGRLALAFILPIAATAVAHAQCPDGAPPPCGPARASFDADVVAIAPFDVLLPSLQLWREGLVDVLSRRLDGAGPLRTVSASAVIHRWSGRADPASARRLGQRTRAQFAVFGELVSAGPDSVRVSVSVLDVPTGRVTGTAEVHNSSARMDLLADTLTIRLLGVLGRARGGGVLSAVDFDTHSLPALKAYLEGDQLFRRARHDSAAVHFSRAIALDSGFMQARRRLAWTAQWKCDGEPPDFTVLDNVLSRIGGTRALSPRDSLSLQIDSLWIAFSRGGSFLDVFPDLVAQLQAATARGVKAFPRDAEFWHFRGEALSMVERNTPAIDRLALAAFERATAADPGLAPPFADAAEAAADLGDYNSARRWTQAYLHAGVGGSCAAKASLFADLLPGSLTGVARERRLRDAPSAELWRVVAMFARFVDIGETEVALQRIAFERRLSRFPTKDTLVSIRRPLATSLLFRGRLRAADSVSVGTAASENRMFVGAIVPATLPTSRPWEIDKAPLEQVIHPQGLWLVDGFVRARDTVSLDRLARRADSLFLAVPPHAPGESMTRSFSSGPWIFESDQRRNTLAYGAAFIRAARLLATGDTNAAVQGLTALPDSTCYGCFQHVVMLARVFASQGRYESAAPYYRRDFPYVRDARHVLWAFERAVVLERIHDREGAVENYQFVVNAWRHPDAELAGFVEQARQGLRRLR